MELNFVNSSKKNVCKYSIYFALIILIAFVTLFCVGIFNKSDTASSQLQTSVQEENFANGETDTELGATNDYLTFTSSLSNGSFTMPEYDVTVETSASLSTDYSITYYTNGGVWGSGSPEKTSYKYTDSAIWLDTNITKPGYVFDGWYSNSSLSGSPVEFIPMNSNENKVFYAKWLEKSKAKYIEFTSSSTFSVQFTDSTKRWNGTLFYSTNAINWVEWNGETVSASFGKDSKYHLYFRGTGNTVITGVKRENKNIKPYQGFKFISGIDISVSGNALSLLNYSNIDSVTLDEYAMIQLFFDNSKILDASEFYVSTAQTKLSTSCFDRMFAYSTSLKYAPNLPATTLGSYCYWSMFYYCPRLKTAPELPATSLAYGCYLEMFACCFGLTTAPNLPATTLEQRCYQSMFRECTSLTTAPNLPATTLEQRCYESMFRECTSLTTAPELPATTLDESCYGEMFQGCTSLIKAPSLPATTLANSCYASMFANCTSLTKAPSLPATTMASNCYQSMFSGCTNLTTAPELPATTLAEDCYKFMFGSCENLITIPILSATELPDSCYSNMFSGCLKIKLSATQTGEYQTPYKIPFNSDGTCGTNSLNDMFTLTGGTFVETPTINTTYYLSTSNSLSGVVEVKLSQGEGTNLRISPNQTSFSIGEQVTVYASLSTGYTDLVVAVYKTGDMITQIPIVNGKFTVPNYGVTVMTSAEPQSYQIIYKDCGNLAFSGTHKSGYPTSHKYGTTTTLMSATKDNYSFGGWFKTSDCSDSAITIIDKTEITSDITLYAKWIINTYTISINVNDSLFGSVSQSEISDVPYGTSISVSGNTIIVGEITITATPTANTSQYTYSFVSWSNTSTIVQNNLTITANFSRVTNTYTIVWKNYDGTILETDNNVAYGTTPKYNGATPTRPDDVDKTYTFSGWNPSVVSVTGNAEYVALFTSGVSRYTYYFYDENGNTILKKSTNDYGTQIVAPDNPTKSADNTYTYSFDGWFTDKTGGTKVTSFGTLTKDVSYYARYNKSYINYTIKFIDYDDSEISVKTDYHYGDTISMPTDPTRENYSFTGWSPSVPASVVKDSTFIAQYEINKFTVTISINNAEYGSVSRTKLDNIPYGSNITIYNNTINVNGLVVTASPNTKTAQYSFFFDSWTNAVTLVQNDITITANFSRKINSYIIVWKNYDGTVLETDENVEYGTMPEYNGNMPTKPAEEDKSYNFIGWTPDVSNVVGNVEYTATFADETNKYSYTFYDENGTTILKSEIVDYDSQIIAPENPTKSADNTYTYSFDGWFTEKTGGTKVTSFGKVTKDIKFYARYINNYINYIVKFLDYDNSEILVKTNYHYGDTIIMPNDPTRENYLFVGWSPETSSTVTGDVTYIAQYEINKFNVIIGLSNTEYGTLSQTQIENIPYASSIVVSGNKLTINDVTITATPNERTAQYTYAFVSWDNVPKKLEGNLTITANFSRTVNKYTIVWKNYDGTILETDENVEYGVIPEYNGATPTRPNEAEKTYIFNAWNPEVVYVTENAEYVATFTTKDNEYTYTFYDEDGITILKTATEAYDTQIVAPDAPTKQTDKTFAYTFAGWYTDVLDGTKIEVFERLKKDVQFFARYSSEYVNYTITFLDYDNSEISSKTDYHYGDEIVAPITLTREGYQFVGWSPDLSATVTDNETYTAQYEIKIFTLTIISNNTEYGTVSQTTLADLPYGTVIVAQDNKLVVGELTITATPNERTAKFTYSFESWSEQSVVLDEDLTITANFIASLNVYTITFINGDVTTQGTLTLTIKYGEKLPEITLPQKSEFALKGFFTKENGRGEQYYSAEGISDMVYELDSDITLYACWSYEKQTPYMIVFAWLLISLVNASIVFIVIIKREW